MERRVRKSNGRDWITKADCKMSTVLGGTDPCEWGESKRKRLWWTNIVCGLLMLVPNRTMKTLAIFLNKEVSGWGGQMVRVI